jgi:hypothetical protein
MPEKPGTKKERASLARILRRVRAFDRSLARKMFRGLKAMDQQERAANA